MFYVENNCNYSRLTPIDKVSDEVGVKVIALIPVVANVVMFVKQLRLNYVMNSEKYSAVDKGIAFLNMTRFTDTNLKWGQVQVIGFMSLGIIALLASSFVAPTALVITATACVFIGFVLKTHQYSIGMQIANEKIKLMEEGIYIGKGLN